MKKNNSAGRRDFLKAAAAGTAAIAMSPGVGKVFGASAGPTQPSPLNKWPGRVAVNFNKAAITGSTSSKYGTVDATVVRKMIDQTITLLTGIDDIGEAWKSIFPSTLSLTSKIAVKINCYNPYKAGQHWSVARGVTDGLMKMKIGETLFPGSNITVYETNTKGGNSITTGGYTKNNFPDVNLAFEKDWVDGGDGALGKTYARSLKEADFLINTFNARGHQMPTKGSKFTMGFKSHYGTYYNPSFSGPNYLHDDDKWDMTFREIVCIGPVYKKLVLSVCGGMFGTDEGYGPGLSSSETDIQNIGDFTKYAQLIDSTSTTRGQTTVIMSTDPVSAEMQSIKILRMNKNISFAFEDMPKYLKASAGIDVSGLTPTYNIGIIDEDKMDFRKMVNDVVIKTPVVSPASADHTTAKVGMSTHPITGHGSVSINFNLPVNHVGSKAVIEIFDARGSLVRKLSHEVGGINNQLSWNQKDSRGVPAAKGMYIARLSCGGTRLSSQFSIVR
ncbi:MAG: DUF362 domain-containing protein [Chitinispirillaceae bacterium]|nr:DUF362 domain-containing protein [Chitinispirillaceae bacterium]